MTCCSAAVGPPAPVPPSEVVTNGLLPAHTTLRLLVGVRADDVLVEVAEPAELVGRRVVALIPPSLREAHVTGFSRHLTTGQVHLLDVPLELPVLHRDGREIACSFLVQRAQTPGRPVYLAWIDPLES